MRIARSGASVYLCAQLTPFDGVIPMCGLRDASRAEFNSNN
jgi:hypothetical protein